MQSSLPSSDDLLSVLGVFDIIIGLAHGIGFLNTENGNDCQEYLEEQQVAVKESIEQFDTDEGGDQAIKAYFEGINQIILIFWNINDTFTNCYEAMLDSVVIMGNYATLITDSSSLRTNLIDNFGLAYNSIRDLITFFQRMEESNIKSAQDFGKAFGFVFFYLLYPGAEEGEIELD